MPDATRERVGGRLVLAVAGLVCASLGASAAPITTVMVEGMHAPGLPAGVTLNSLNDRNAALNEVGQAAFAASLGGAGITSGNEKVIYRYVPGGIYTVVARGADSIPAAPGATYDGNSPSYLGAGSMNVHGSVVFQATPNPVSVLNASYFIDGSTVVATREQTAPDTGGATYGSLPSGSTDNARLNDAGQTLYATPLVNAPAGTGSVLYLDTTIVAREGGAAPGTTGTFGAFTSVDRALLNNAGDVAFQVDLQAAPSVNADNNGVLYKYDAATQTLNLIARDGDAAPGSPGKSFDDTTFRSLNLNAGGDVAYIARYTTGEYAIFKNQSRLVGEGDAARGVTNGTQKVREVNGLAFNDAGSIFYEAILSGDGVINGNQFALYLDQTMIARVGTPGPIAGTEISAFVGGRLALNNLGQAVFLAQLALNQGGVTSADDLVLLGWTGAELVVLAREGDSAGGGVITSLSASPRAVFEINDAGDVLFWAQIDLAREGLFMSAIPEPASLALAALGCVALASGRRR